MQFQPLLGSPHLATDHPNAFNTDAVERAQKYATEMGGGVGSYTNSQGILAVREVLSRCPSNDIQPVELVACSTLVSYVLSRTP